MSRQEWFMSIIGPPLWALGATSILIGLILVFYVAYLITLGIAAGIWYVAAFVTSII